MSRVDITPAARQDLFEIWEYIARHNPPAADQRIRRLDAAFGLMARFPGAGPERPEFGAGLGGYVVKPHVIFYRQTADGLEVLRVLHGARRIDSSYFT